MLMESDRNFSNAEMLVVRQLLGNYPAAGLTTVSKLAQLAEVSDPTVLRVATRLGFSGFAELQQALLAEVEAHMRSPLTLASGERAEAVGSISKSNPYQRFLAETASQLDVMRNEVATADYERAASMLCDRRLRIAFLGGRFSRFIAGLMQRSLNNIRDGSFLVDGNAADMFDELVAFDRRHVLVVFDYRRYQSDVVRFAKQAKDRGTQILLFTDRWRSPIAHFADFTLEAPTEAASPFDTLVMPLVQAEAVIAGITDQLDGDWQERAAPFEPIRDNNQITVDSAAQASSRRSKSTRRGK